MRFFVFPLKFSGILRDFLGFIKNSHGFSQILWDFGILGILWDSLWFFWILQDCFDFKVADPLRILQFAQIVILNCVFVSIFNCICCCACICMFIWKGFYDCRFSTKHAVRADNYIRIVYPTPKIPNSCSCCCSCSWSKMVQNGLKWWKMVKMV